MGADQTIAEFQASFAVTGCIADAVRGRGRLIAAVDGGDRVVQAVWRSTIQKTLKRDSARYADVALVEVRPGKAPPADRIASIDRVLLVGVASEILSDRKRASGLLRALGEMTKTGGFLGVVDLCGARSVDVKALVAVAGEAGWEPADEMTTDTDGLLLLKFRKR